MRIWIIVLSCGCGTFLFRMLPMKFNINEKLKNGSRSLHQVLMAIGPAAICSFLITSVWPEFQSNPPLASAIVLLLSFTTIAVTKKLTGGIVFPMCCGVIIYGLLHALSAATGYAYLQLP